MSLFEDWYLTYYEGFIDLQKDLEKDGDGNYIDRRTFVMYEAFLAGQILCEEE